MSDTKQEALKWADVNAKNAVAVVRSAVRVAILRGAFTDIEMQSICRALELLTAEEKAQVPPASKKAAPKKAASAPKKIEETEEEQDPAPKKAASAPKQETIVEEEEPEE